MILFAFLFTAAHCHPTGRLHFSFSVRPINFSCCFSKEICLLCLSLVVTHCLSFSLLAPLACLLLSRFLCLFLSLHSQFVDIALEDTDRETISAFHFVFIDPLIVFATRDAVGHAISAKEIRVVFGLPYLLIDYFTLVCLRGGQTGVLIHSNQIFLSMVLRCVRFAQERAPLSRHLNSII